MRPQVIDEVQRVDPVSGGDELEIADYAFEYDSEQSCLNRGWGGGDLIQDAVPVSCQP